MALGVFGLNSFQEFLLVTPSHHFLTLGRESINSPYTSETQIRHHRHVEDINQTKLLASHVFLSSKNHLFENV